MKPKRAKPQIVEATGGHKSRLEVKSATAAFIRRRLGRAMKRIRQDSGITQEQLAAWLKVGQGNVSRYERGLQWVESPERLWMLARALRVPPWVLLLAADDDKHTPEELRDAATLVHRFLALSQGEQRALLQAVRKVKNGTRG